MKKSRFSEEQIIRAIHEHDGGKKAEDICRELGVSQGSFYAWKKQYAGLGIAELRELRQLREENARLKTVVADLTLDRHILQEALSKKSLKPVEKRELVDWARALWPISERRGCRLFQLDRSSYRYEHHRDPQHALRLRLKELAAVRVRFGYVRLWAMLRREGWQINRKRVYRLYKLDGLEVRTKKRRKMASHARVSPPAATAPHERWSMDFVSDRLVDGTPLRVLTVVDQFSRLNLALEARRSFSGDAVSRVLDSIAALHGYPDRITVDNGSEFASNAMDAWAAEHGVQLDFIRPGKPVENSYIESFNGRVRDECLNVNVFFSTADANDKLKGWAHDYNVFRPHGSLAGRTPCEYLNDFEAAVRDLLPFDLDRTNQAARQPCQGDPSGVACGHDLDRAVGLPKMDYYEIEGKDRQQKAGRVSASSKCDSRSNRVIERVKTTRKS